MLSEQQEELESDIRSLPKHGKALNKGSGWNFDLMDDHYGGMWIVYNTPQDNKAVLAPLFQSVQVGHF